MSISDASEADILKLFFQNINWANLGDATGVRGSTAAGNLYIALHTADPGETGSATTNEATYTGYARKAVPRTNTDWTVSGTAPTQAANTNALSFAACSGGSNTITHYSIVRDSSGASEILWSGALTSSLGVSNNITPTVAAGAIVCTLD